MMLKHNRPATWLSSCYGESNTHSWWIRVVLWWVILSLSHSSADMPNMQGCIWYQHTIGNFAQQNSESSGSTSRRWGHQYSSVTLVTLWPAEWSHLPTPPQHHGIRTDIFFDSRIGVDYENMQENPLKAVIKNEKTIKLADGSAKFTKSVNIMEKSMTTVKVPAMPIENFHLEEMSSKTVRWLREPQQWPGQRRERKSLKK